MVFCLDSEHQLAPGVPLPPPTQLSEDPTEELAFSVQACETFAPKVLPMVVEAPSQGHQIGFWLGVPSQEEVPLVVALQYARQEPKEAPWVEEAPCYLEA